MLSNAERVPKTLICIAFKLSRRKFLTRNLQRTSRVLFLSQDMQITLTFTRCHVKNVFKRRRKHRNPIEGGIQQCCSGIYIKAIYNRLAHIHLPLVDLYSSILCLEEVPIVKCNKSWSSEKLSISINISTEWLAKIHFDIWEYKFYEKDCRCSARN